jgi:hypothetical protein
MVWTEITRPKYRRDDLRYASKRSDGRRVGGDRALHAIHKSPRPAAYDADAGRGYCILIRFSIAPMTIQRLKLRSQHDDVRPRIDRQPRVLFVCHDRVQFIYPGVACAATMPSSARCARKAFMI